MSLQDRRENEARNCLLLYPPHPWPDHSSFQGIITEAEDTWSKAGGKARELRGGSESVCLSSIHQRGGKRLPFSGL